MLPENLVQACFQQVQTITVKHKPHRIKFLNISLVPNISEEDYIPIKELEFKDGTNILGKSAIAHIPYM